MYLAGVVTVGTEQGGHFLSKCFSCPLASARVTETLSKMIATAALAHKDSAL